MVKITVLGMGAMGSRMARSLIGAKYDVTVWNRNRSKTKEIEQLGAKVADTPREAVRETEVAIAMVRDDEASKAVWLGQDGALAGMNREAIAIESSTLTVDWIEKLGKECERRKIAFLDAPVAGTRPQAEAAQLIYFVGGNRAAFERVQPILQTMGNKTHYIGAIGSGMAIKLAVNSLFAIQVSAMGELIGLMCKSGLDEAEAVEVLTSTPVCSPAAAMAAKAIIGRKFTPLFPIELVSKDLKYAIASTDATNLPLVTAAQKIYDMAIERGYGADNITGIAQLYY